MMALLIHPAVNNDQVTVTVTVRLQVSGCGKISDYPAWNRPTD